MNKSKELIKHVELWFKTINMIWEVYQNDKSEGKYKGKWNDYMNKFIADSVRLNIDVINKKLTIYKAVREETIEQPKFTEISKDNNIESCNIDNSDI